MEAYINEIEALEKEITALEKEVEYRERLTRARDEALLMYRKYYEQCEIPFSSKSPDFHPHCYIGRIGPYDIERFRHLPEFETRWKNSCFVTSGQALNFCKYNSFNIEETRLFYEKNSFFNLDLQARITTEYIAYLDAVIPCDNGVRLLLSDPFATVETEVITDESLISYSYLLIGHLCDVNAKTLYRKDYSKITVTSLQRSLFEDMTNFTHDDVVKVTENKDRQISF